MRLPRVLVLVLATALLVSARPLHAQADVIRGTIVGPDKKPIENVNVTVSYYDGSLNHQAKTDKNGKFSVAFPDGSGDYWVTLNALGYLPRKYEVKRLGDEDVLIADASLSKTATTLDAVHVTASRQRPNRNDNATDIGGNDRGISTSALGLDQLGDLNAMAASLPGVTYIPGADGGPAGFSVLGLGSDQNLTTLDGSATSASTLPRDAQTGISLSTGTYDVSQGGASGATLNITTRGGNDFYARSMSTAPNLPAFQWNTPAGLAASPRSTYVDLGGGVSGPIKLDKIFYAGSYQFSQQLTPVQTLLNTSPLGLETDGISADSVNRLLSILGQDGVPTTLGRIPGNTASKQGRLLGRFDFSPPSPTSGQQFAISVNGAGTLSAPVSAGVTSLPAYGGSRENWNAGTSLRATDYWGCCVLSETNIGINATRNSGTPYLAIPAGRVLVASTFADGTPGTSRNLSFGGNPSLNSASTTSSFSYKNLLSWFSSDNKHRLKFTTEAYEDAFWQNFTSNELGTFTYNSLADVAAGTPATYTRQLTPHILSGNQIRGGTSLGDAWRPTTDFQLQYGVRLDGNRFNTTPEFNPTLEQDFGLKNSSVPDRIYASPRVGFSWTYGTAQQVAALLGSARTPRAVVRGGIGMFQNLGAASLLQSPLNANGLPTGIQQLTCTGAAVPTPTWSDYAANVSSIPDQCADGTMGTVFASTAPLVTVFDPNYVQARSVRGNLQWTGATMHNFFYTSLNYIYSLNLNQPETADLNFAPTTRFSLSNEASRPVYVYTTSIVPSTGAIASRDARVTQDFSTVSELRSDAMSISKQVQLTVSPVQYSSAYSWSASYVHLDVRDYGNGFSRNTDGNPLDKDWARSPNDYHHQISLNLGYNAANVIRVNVSGRVQSGGAFTPVVGGDINGDGYSGNDRAFVFDPAHTADPNVASAMETLLNSGSAAARSCLGGQLGQVAGRNTCQQPWSETLGMSFSFNSLKLGLPQRAQVSFSIGNVLGGADLLLHGPNHLQGWGQPAIVDPTLLYVRGFNSSTDQYIYQVNPRFGSTISTTHQPTTLNMQVSVDIGPPRERQSLTQMLDRGRTAPGSKTTAATIKAIYGGGGVYNPMAQLLRESDSLKLTTVQADTIAAYNRWFTTRLDSLWTPIAGKLAILPDKYDQGEAYRTYRAGREQSFDLLIELAPKIMALLTGPQQRMLPPTVSSYLDPRFLEQTRSSTSAGSVISIGGIGGGGAVRIGGP